TAAHRDPHSFPTRRSSDLRAAGLSAEFRPCYTTISAVGKRTDLTAAHLAREAVKPLVAGTERLTFALDDTPTERYGRHVQGAGRSEEHTSELQSRGHLVCR